MYYSKMSYNETVTAMRKIRIAYNDSLRSLLGIPNLTVQVRCTCNLILCYSVNYRGNMYSALYIGRFFQIILYWHLLYCRSLYLF